MKDQALENSVITLHTRGWSIRRISRGLGISRGRIGRILGTNTENRDTGNQVVTPSGNKRESKLDPYREIIADFLEKYSNATGQRVFEHLKQSGYQGGITIVRDYLHALNRQDTKQAVQLVETDPGQRAAHDWSDYNIRFTSDQNGTSTQVTFFSYILAYSRRQYIEIVADKTRMTLLRVLINAFVYLIQK